MSRSSSQSVRRWWVKAATAAGVAGVCYLPTAFTREPLPRIMPAKAAAEKAFIPAGAELPGVVLPVGGPAVPSVGSARQPEFVPASMTPDGWKGTARGSIAATPARLDIPRTAAVVPDDVRSAARPPAPVPAVAPLKTEPVPTWVALATGSRIPKELLPDAPAADSAGSATKPAVPAASGPPVLPPLPPSVREPGATTPADRTENDAVVLVGGVAVELPSEPIRPVSVAGKPPAATGAFTPPLALPSVVADQADPVFAEPPIRSLGAPVTSSPLKELPSVPATPPTPTPLPPSVAAQPPGPLPAPALLPGPPPGLPAPPPGAFPPPVLPGEVVPGPIEVGGVPMPYDSLSRLIDGGDFGPGIGGGCASCGGACAGGVCRAGGRQCEPFPARNCFGRFIGMVYEGICCPDPCYKPRWEPITAAAFFVDAPRPVTQTRVRWDYAKNFSYPDRGEFFWARADGNGKGPRPNPPALGVPGVDYHELYLDQEIATGGGAGSVTISQPYRSVNPTPFAESAAGFGDLQITAKSLLFDSELFLFAFQMRTYIPTGQFRKGLGTGHLSLEPGLIAGVRVSPDCYAVAQVEEWIPIAGDKDYMGAALRYNFAFNTVLWRPVRDVQFIGTWEATGISFQDGAFTDPVLGRQKLSGQTSLGMGLGGRLFFCDKFDLGAGWNHGITGKYLVDDQLRVEFRYRY